MTLARAEMNAIDSPGLQPESADRRFDQQLDELLGESVQSVIEREKSKGALNATIMA